MWKKIADFILRNRFFIVGLITLITVFFAYHAITGLKLENKYGIVLPKNSPTTENYKKFKTEPATAPQVFPPPSPKAPQVSTNAARHAPHHRGLQRATYPIGHPANQAGAYSAACQAAYSQCVGYR